ncbi:MAG TPA: sulfite exporter TauE/SafE family protein [Candidatus Limnocylindrales bacterium]|nr:sulfite exporter TauE/SafE family protein [Candidatus Limnocylindrales bacterium]
MGIGLLLVAGGAVAGLFGSLLGLGGGILIVPLLTLGFGRPLREAVAVSLVCVIATSSAAAGAYLRSRLANLRLGMVLVLFTTIGALVGGIVAFLLPERVLTALFAILLGYVAFTMIRRRDPADADGPAVLADGSQPARATTRLERATSALAGPDYVVRRLVPASVASLGAGVLSALLGVGGGAINVPTMHLIMGTSLRVAAATSNLMIGVTAVASAIIYFLRGAVDPYIAGPTVVGVFVGASIGSRISGRVDVRILRALFVLVLVWTAIQMARRAVGL